MRCDRQHNRIKDASDDIPKGGRPVWIRAPKQGHEFYTGFSKAKLYDLATEGLIKSVSIRQKGKTKGTRLFHLGSILRFIDQTLSRQQKGENRKLKTIKDESYHLLLNQAKKGNTEAISDLLRDYDFKFGEDTP